MKGKGLQFSNLNPSNFSADFVRENPGLFGKQVSSTSTKEATVKPEVQKTKEMNKTERQYYNMLKVQYPRARILYEAYTFLLANRLRYRPDFAVIQGREVEFHEVKGAHLFKNATESATRMSLTKPKIAAEIFPHKFFVARKHKGGRWEIIQLTKTTTSHEN